MMPEHAKYTHETLRELADILAGYTRRADALFVHAAAWEAQLAVANMRLQASEARVAAFPWFLLQESAEFLRNDKDLAGDMAARNLAYRLELAVASPEPLGEEGT